MINSFALEFPSTGIAGQQKCFDTSESELMPTSAYILTSGDYVREAFPSLSAIPGFSRIKKNLKEDLGVEVGNALQLNAARNILAGRNCFLIGSSHSKAGKSLAYLIPVITRLLENAEGYAKLEGDGPLTLIVCSTNASGLKLEEALMNLTEGSDLRFEFMQEQERYDADLDHHGRKRGLLSCFHKSADVVLCTAEVAAALIKDTQSPFSFERLSFMIFDDAHVTLKFQQEEVKTILKGFTTFVEKLECRKCLLQTIFCASQWTPELELCYAQLTDIPVLIISSAIQAIKYCKFNITVVETSQDTRCTDFKQILSHYKEAKRIIVVMKDWETVKQLRMQCLIDKLDIHFLEGKGFVGAFMQTARRAWDCDGNRRVTICTSDTNLRELKVSNADLLIHYDIPEDDLRTFAVRFTSVWNNINNIKNADQRPPTSCVMLSTDLPEANVILWKLHTLGAKIPPNLLQIAREEKLSRMKKVAVCRGFICMGHCLHLDESVCPHRHYFVDEDFSQKSVLPKTGQVELFVTETLAPNFYIAKILRYCDRDPVTNKVIEYKDYKEEALHRHLRLKELLDLSKGPETFQPGTKVVIALRDKQEFRYMYTRGEIIEVATRTYAGLPNAVRVNCMDIGEIKLIRVDDILAIPDEMVDLHPCSVQVVLANTAPPFGEKTFRLSHTSKTKDYYKLDPILQADICLSIGKTVWVRRLVKLRRLDIGRMVETWDATYELCKKKILVRNPGHLDMLYTACEERGFSCAMYRNRKTPGWCQDVQFLNEFHQTTDGYDWAYLKVQNTNNEKDIVSSTVAAKYISEDNKIYVNIVKFEHILDALETELNEEILRLKLSSDWNKEVEFHRFYEPGVVVAAIDTMDGRYRRGVITQVEQKDTEKDLEYSFKVFLVDVGAEGVCTMSSIFPIPKIFVSRLPFQAVRLSLEHVRCVKPKSADHRIYLRTIEFLMPDNLSVEVEVVATRNYRVNGDILEINCYESFIFGGKDEIGEYYLREKVALFTFDGEMEMLKIKSVLLEKLNAQVAELLKGEEEETSEDEFDVNVDPQFEVDSDDDRFDVNFDIGLEEMVASMFPKQQTPVGGHQQKQLPAVPSKPEITAELTYAPVNHLVGNRDRPNQRAINPPHIIDVLKKADVEWFQNDAIILLRVLIPEVAEYDCRLLSKSEIHFSTINPLGYGFTLNLFKRVESTVKVQSFGQYCEIKLWKRMPGLKWDVLTPATGLHWIKPEINLGDDDAESEASSKLFEYQDVDYEQMCEDEYNSDDELYELNPEEDKFLNS
ncbi:unnamed protein product [Allacma fusca]|uniref:RNA helicase n=1 Tax=Allacma fusca TaxID=39272 RepID=A0A8J2JI64_9HEXA|nr:unnamed protein product [Allacma fusca]